MNVPANMALALHDLHQQCPPQYGQQCPPQLINPQPSIHPAKMIVAQHLGVDPNHPAVGAMLMNLANYGAQKAQVRGTIPGCSPAQQACDVYGGERGDRRGDRLGRSGNLYGELRAITGIDVIFHGTFTAVAGAWGTDVPTGAKIRVLKEGIVLLWDFQALSADYDAVDINEMIYNTDPYSIPKGASLPGLDFSGRTFQRFVPKPCMMRPGDNVDIAGTAVAQTNTYKINGVGVPVTSLYGMHVDFVLYLAEAGIPEAIVEAKRRNLLT